MAEHVFLVPGFFGFANLGELKYFAHVADELAHAFEGHRRDVRIHYVPTLPTASLRRRAARLVEAISTHAGDGGDVHIVGHSTGGLDARLAVTPNADLGTSRDDLLPRVRTVVTVASPHYGAPIANFFTSVMGQRLLRLLSLTTIHGLRLGRIPMPALLALAGALRVPGRFPRPTNGMLEQVQRQVLADFGPERRSELESFIGEVGEDQSLLPQLSPAGMDLFNAAVVDNPAVRYGCVVTRARPPALRGNLKLGVAPTAQAMYGLYRGLHALAGASPVTAPPPTAEQMDALRRGFGDAPQPGANDAIVPTRSQLWGDVIHAVWADHLDVVGHFFSPDSSPPHVQLADHAQQLPARGLHRAVGPDRRLRRPAGGARVTIDERIDPGGGVVATTLDGGGDALVLRDGPTAVTLTAGVVAAVVSRYGRELDPDAEAQSDERGALLLDGGRRLRALSFRAGVDVEARLYLVLDGGGAPIAALAREVAGALRHLAARATGNA